MSIILLVGPTGSGNTRLLREVAATLPGHAYGVDLAAEPDPRWNPPHDNVATATLDHVSQSPDGAALACDAVRWASEGESERTLVIAVQQRRDLFETALPANTVEVVLGPRRIDAHALLRMAGLAAAG